MSQYFDFRELKFREVIYVMSTEKRNTIILSPISLPRRDLWSHCEKVHVFFSSTKSLMFYQELDWYYSAYSEYLEWLKYGGKDIRWKFYLHFLDRSEFIDNVYLNHLRSMTEGYLQWRVNELPEVTSRNEYRPVWINGYKVSDLFTLAQEKSTIAFKASVPNDVGEGILPERINYASWFVTPDSNQIHWDLILNLIDGHTSFHHSVSMEEQFFK